MSEEIHFTTWEQVRSKPLMMNLMDKFLTLNKTTPILEYHVTPNGSVKYFYENATYTSAKPKILSVHLFKIFNLLGLDNSDSKYLMKYGEERFLIELTEEIRKIHQREGSISGAGTSEQREEIIKLTSEMIPFMDLRNPSNAIMYSVAGDCVSTMGFKSWDTIVKSYTAILRKLKLDTPPITPAVLFFDPHGPQGLGTTEVSGNEMPTLNTYIPPTYYHTEISNDERKRYVDIFLSFTSFLIPDSEGLEYSMNWIFNMLTTRNEVALCLIGPPGVGKTHYADNLACLIGRHNYTATKNNFLSTDFNSPLINNQLVYMDELVNKTPAQMEAFKKMTNDYIQVERKHQDQYTEKNHSNILISTNGYHTLRFRVDDRRTSVIRTTDRNPNEVFGKEIYTGMRGLVDNENYLRSIYDYILQKYNPPIYNTFERLRNTEFEKAVVETSNTTIQYLLDILGFRLKHSQLTEIHYSQLKKDLIIKEKYPSRHICNMETIKAFCRDFTWNGKIALEVVYDTEIEDFLIRKK